MTFWGEAEMTLPAINGFMIVNAPDATGYRGVDREPWSIIDAGYHAGGLPEDIRTGYERMRSDRSRGFWWPISKSLPEASRALAFTRRRDPGAELIAVSCRYLQDIAGTVPSTNRPFALLGFDVVAIGEWSLLRVLSETEDVVPPDVKGAMNDRQLLRSRGDVSFIERLYRRLAEGGQVETIADVEAALPVEDVAVYFIDGVNAE